MSYAGYAATVRSKASSLSNASKVIKGLNFNGVWKSNAGISLINSLDSVVSSIGSQVADLNSFAGAIARIDELIALDEKIEQLTAQLGALDPSDEKEADMYASITAELSRLKEKREILKNQIVASLGGFGSVESSYSYSFGGIASWNELVEKSKRFSKLPAGNLLKALTLYDQNGNVIRDGEEYVNDVINSIKQKYTGIERNIYMTNAIIDLSLEAGVRIPYVHNGTNATGQGIDTRLAVSTSALGKGVDCNAFVSYIIYDEESTEKWLSVGQFEVAGETVNSYEQMQAGDIFANGGHVGMIVENNPETGEALILHATGTEMRYEKVNYDYFAAKGHSIRRVDSTYVSSELGNILGVDTSNYQPATADFVVDTNKNSYNNTVSLSVDTANNSYVSNYDIGTVNMNGDIYNGQALTAPQGINRNGPMASETWYDLNMNGVVKNMEKLYGFSNLEASIRDDGVKVLSGMTPEGEYFEDLVMVAADVQHMSNPTGTFERGEVVETSLGTGIVVDYCERAVNERKDTGNIHFDIATAWGTGEYKERAYADYNNK